MPTSLGDFLKDLILELNDLITNGYEQNSNLYIFDIMHFNCDAPAQSYVKSIKNNNSYYGCEKCVQKGIFVDGHVKFLDIESPLRSNEDFSSFAQKEHHISETPLLNISSPNFGLVSKFPLDVMHLIDLGVVRKMILYWIRNGQK